MKKIAIITFHWATNFGAVLQAYALQQHLLSSGHEAEIIDYVPWNSVLFRRIRWRRKHRTDLIAREEKLEIFRTKYLVRTKRINRCSLLKRLSEDYSVVICGSDQIWNQSFTLFGEYKPTLAYFACFAGKETKRIAYAASFGSATVSERYKKYAKPELKKFSAISVRETTGKQIVESFGLKADIVCDPTLLLTKESYWRITKNIDMDVPKVFSYVLHEHIETKKIEEYVKRKVSGDSAALKPNSIEEWLYAIQYSELVVTNSFHGVMLSIILNKPFIAVLIKGSGMNDRLNTILAAVGLDDRAVDSYDEEKIDAVLRAPIEWNQVNNRLEELRSHGREFFDNALI